MSINIDKVIESLPENLIFKTDSCQITSNQNLCPNTVWGPFDVEKFVSDMNQTHLWEKIKILNCEWVNFLVEKHTNKMLPAAKLNISDFEEGNITLTFNKKDFQVTISTKEEIDMGNEIKCNLAIMDQSPSKVQSHTDSLSDSDQNNEKLSKTCKFCGINFSHQCTLDAHMTYYCSKRQSLLGDSNPSPKCQKTWRTRQRNKQTNNQKINSNDISAFNKNLFGEDSSKFKIIDRNISSKLRLNVINGSETHSNTNSIPIVSHPSAQKRPVLSATVLTNGNSVNLNSGEPERLCSQLGSNSDSEPEIGSTSTLGFCAPCGLFFSSKELYDIHIQLDLTNFQSSIAKCNSLVLAAPVFNNNGLQYVPIHPRTAVITKPTNNVQKPKSHVPDENSCSVPLDLSINNTSKSPSPLQNEIVHIDAVNRLAAVSGLTVSNCNQILRSNKRPFLCQHCQTRFQLYSTFEAHQEFYCQGKRQQTDVSEKRCRTTNNNSCKHDFEILVPKNDDISWKFCNQGFKCEGCGFIGQTKRGIRIHCKNQCFKRFQNHKLETKCDEVEINSPTSDVWANANTTYVTVGLSEQPDLRSQDSPVKVESV